MARWASAQEISEAAAKIVQPLRGPAPARVEDSSLPYEPRSIACSLQHALSWTASLSDKSGPGKRRWCKVSAELLVGCLERDFEIAHGNRTREELVGIVAAALVLAPARPDCDWVGRQPWAHRVAGAVADTLAACVTVIGTRRSGSTNRHKDPAPTWM
jgi:hypothetical protein